MYAYVMRPDTLPKSYYKFILHTGPIDDIVLSNLRQLHRTGTINYEALKKFIVEKSKKTFALKTNQPDILPCSVLHPRVCFRLYLWSFFQ